LIFMILMMIEVYIVDNKCTPVILEQRKISL
jgi:hypothetical protein